MAYRNLQKEKDWKIIDLTSYSVGDWEPNYDLRLFELKKEVALFVQNVRQEDSEVLSSINATPVKILKLKNLPK